MPRSLEGRDRSTASSRVAARATIVARGHERRARRADAGRFVPVYEGGALEDVDGRRRGARRSSRSMPASGRVPASVVPRAGRAASSSPVSVGDERDRVLVDRRRRARSTASRRAAAGRSEGHARRASAATATLIAGTDARRRSITGSSATTPTLTDVVAGQLLAGHRARVHASAATRSSPAPRTARVSAWFRAPVGADGDARRWCGPHDFEPQGSAVTAIAASTRDRTFATAGARRLASSCGIRPPGGRWSTLPRHDAGRAGVVLTPRSDGAAGRAADGRDRPLRTGQSASRSQLEDALRQGLVRGLRQPGVRLAVDRRDRRLRAEVQPGAADLRHDQGHVLRAALRDSAGGPRRALHVAVRAPDDPGPDQADGRDHGGAAERRHRLPRRPLSGAGRRAQPRRRAADDASLLPLFGTSGVLVWRAAAATADAAARMPAPSCC